MATEKRLIYANELIEWLKKAGRYLKGLENTKAVRKAIGVIINHIEEIPTVDAVEVVRCKDCKFGDMCSIREAMAVSDWNAYCYRGERKDNG